MSYVMNSVETFSLNLQQRESMFKHVKDLRRKIDHSDQLHENGF